MSQGLTYDKVDGTDCFSVDPEVANKTAADREPTIVFGELVEVVGNLLLLLRPFGRRKQDLQHY